VSLHWLMALQLRSFIACNTSAQLLPSVGGAVVPCPGGISLSVNKSDQDITLRGASRLFSGLSYCEFR
jgi:hypothetical protein